MLLNFLNKSGLEIDVLGKIWELSSVLKQTYLSPPEFIIYCKYISMNQCGIPLIYDNLKKYNSQLPFPKFKFEQAEKKESYIEPVKIQKKEIPHQYEEVKRPSVAPNPHAVNSKSFDDFDDFIDPTNDQDQSASITPQTSLSEEERQKLEMEERMKRFDLLNSVFEDALIEEDPSKTKAKVEESKINIIPTNTKSIPPVPQVQNNESNKEVGDDDWDDFAFAEGQTSQGENTEKLSQDVWIQEEALPNESAKAPTHNDDSFDDFAEPENNEPQINEFPMEVDQNTFESPQANPTPTKEDFPSFFDEKTTPRVNIEMADIRMSFPSQDMWSTNLANKNKNSSHNAEETKIDWSSAGQGFTSSNFEFEPSKETINEEDEFGDIMKLKDEVTTKKNKEKLDDSFEDFADAKQTPAEVEKVEPKKIKPLPLKFNRPAPKEDPNKWGSFKFEETDNKVNISNDNSWAKVPNTIDNSEKKSAEINFDPFAEIDIQPSEKLFETPKEINKVENVIQDTPKDSNKDDDDSDFDDFIDPNEAAQEDLSQSSPNYLPPKLESENSNFESKPNFLIKHLPDPKKIEADGKAFEESDFIGGFMKAVTSDNNKHISSIIEPIKDTKIVTNKVEQNIDDGISKKSLMNQIARCFGDSEKMDFNNISSFAQTSIDIDTLKSKIEDSNYMQQVSDTLIKLENYEGAKKVLEHINIITLIQKHIVDKNKAAAEEQYEVAKALRDEIINLKAKLIIPETVLEFVNVNNDHKQPTLKSLLNQVVYRVDDCIAKYFIPKVLENYNSISDKDFDRKIQFKKEVIIDSLVFLKISKIKIENYKRNCDEFVPFLIKEIDSNLVILNEIKSLEPDVIVALKQEDKFNVFLKGLKVLYQITSNIHTSLCLIDKVDTDFAIDFEVYCQQAEQSLKTMKKIMDILDSSISVSSKLLTPQIMSNKVLSDEAILEDRFLSIQRDKYSNMCSLCCTYISNNEGKEGDSFLQIPERCLVFNNTNEEQQTYHNYCINLWINKISRNPH